MIRERNHQLNSVRLHSCRCGYQGTCLGYEDGDEHANHLRSRPASFLFGHDRWYLGWLWQHSRVSLVLEFYGIYSSKSFPSFVSQKTSAINIVGTLPNPPLNAPSFTRSFTCTTGDRLVPNARSYIYIKARGKDINVNALSERFDTKDNRRTSSASGSFFVIECRWQGDLVNEKLPIRNETRHYSMELPSI